MKKLILILLLIGSVFLFLSINVTFTGALIGTNLKITNTIFFILGLTFFIISLILFVENKSLECILIPTKTSKAQKRSIKKAIENYQNINEKNKPYILVSGKIQRDKENKPKKRSQQYLIYKELRKNYMLKPSDLIIEGKSEDTLENFLYSIKKLKTKGINQMKIATNPTQYWRFKLFTNKAKKEKFLDKDFKIEPIYTHESPKEFIYGVLAYIKDYIRIKSNSSLEKARKQKTGNFGTFLKKRLNSEKRKK